MSLVQNSSCTEGSPIIWEQRLPPCWLELNGSEKIGNIMVQSYPLFSAKSSHSCSSLLGLAPHCIATFGQDCTSCALHSVCTHCALCQSSAHQLVTTAAPFFGTAVATSVQFRLSLWGYTVVLLFPILSTGILPGGPDEISTNY